MTSIQKTSSVISLICTAVLWICGSVIALTVNFFPEQPEYKVIQIQLENPSPVKTPAPAPSKKEVAQAKKAAKKAEAAAKKAAQAEAKAQQAEQKLYKSIDDLMAEQRAVKKEASTTSAEDFDKMFGDVQSDTQVAKAETGKVVKQVQEFSGSAGTSGTVGKANTGASSSSAAQKSTGTSTVSEGTSTALESISKTASAAIKPDPFADTSEGGSGNGANGITFSSDADVRALLSPLAISFSKESASKMSGSVRSVQVTFTVNPDGTVSNVDFNKKALLPYEIQQEIYRQVRNLRFASGTGSGQASFLLDIIVK